MAETYQSVPATGANHDAHADPLVAEVADTPGDTAPLVSVHVVESVDTAVLFSMQYFSAWGLQAAGFDLAEAGPQVLSTASPQTVSRNVEQRDCQFTPPSLHVCDLVHKETGQIVGTSRRTGGKRRVEADYVFGKGFYLKRLDVPDHSIGEPEDDESEWLHVDGATYERTGSEGWRRWNTGAFYVADFFWDIFGDGFHGVADLESRLGRVMKLTVATLEETVSTRHYRVKGANEHGLLAIDLWIDSTTGYPLKMVHEFNGSEGTTRSTYTFSRFNEVQLLEVARVWRVRGPIAGTLLAVAS